MSENSNEKRISWSLLESIKDINDEQEIKEFAKKNTVSVKQIKVDWAEFNRYERVPAVELDENGEEVFNMGANLASADPSVYGRLSIKAKVGDLEAKRKMDEMENTPMYRLKKDFKRETHLFHSTSKKSNKKGY